jgi:ribosomal protein S18 acetylase RimI-like enzyme
LNIRKITSDDINECSKLYSKVFSADPWNEPWAESVAFERLQHIFDSKGSLGFLAEDQIIQGFVLGNSEPFYFGEMFYLREMCVDTNLQGTGIGTKILSSLYTDLEARKIKGFYLVTEHTIPAVQFYEKNGIVESKNMKFYSKMFENNDGQETE